MIRIAEKKDLGQVANIHKEQFASHFLGKYSEALIEAFYDCFLHKSYFLVHEEEEKISGFVIGGYNDTLSGAKNNFLRQYRYRSILETLMRPKAWRMAFARLSVLGFNCKHNTYAPQKDDGVRSYRLLSIAVRKNFMGKGIAGELISEFEKEVEKYEKQYGLSVHKKNSRAIRFYEKNGFCYEKESPDSLYLLKEL